MGSPPSQPGSLPSQPSVLWSAKTASSPSRGRSVLPLLPRYLASLAFLCVPFFAQRLAWEARVSSQRRESLPLWSALLRLLLHKETIGSPKFPGYPHGHMPWSQTPVVSCTRAFAPSGLLPSAPLHAVGFPLPVSREALLMTTTLHMSGRNTAPAPLIQPASDSRYRADPRTSLLTCWLDFSQVGLGPCRPSPTG